MTINEIYDWLLNTDPVTDDAEIRMVWSNMASYCYFINSMDFDNVYHQKLKQVLKKSQEYDVSVPDSNHEKVIKLSNRINTKQPIGNYINELLYGESKTVNS